MEKLKRFFSILNQEIESESYKTHEKNATQRSSLFMCFIVAVLTVVDIAMDETSDLMVTGVCFLCFLFLWLATKLAYNRTFVRSVFFAEMAVLFTFIVIKGVGGGYALVWVLFLPFAYMTVLNFKGGLILSAYMAMMLIAFFWTPLKRYLLFDYDKNIMVKFPIIYFCAVGLAVVIAFKTYKATITEISHQDELQKAIDDERRRVERLSLEAITSITNALDARDEYTHRHSEHVAFYSKEIAQALGWSQEDIDDLYTAARLHDLGKIGVPDAILNKQAELTDEEYEIMKNHVNYGAKILSSFETIEGLDVGALYHHERYDGEGYSSGLKGKDIPKIARIIGVADAMDAMYTTRTYREKTSKEYVKEQLRAGIGRQFDPTFAAAALELIDEGMLERMEAEFGEEA